jgi:tRNA threonylcarbamoyladenosine modification (KEOPS) complex  Pcc1 subunit
VSKPKSCTAKIQLSFEKKGTGLKKTDIGSVDKVKNRSSPYSIAQSVSVALKPPRTLSSSSEDPSDFDANVRVSSDEKSNVFIEIESDDIPSLRASINSYLQLADASCKCITEESADC